MMHSSATPQLWGIASSTIKFNRQELHKFCTNVGLGSTTTGMDQMAHVRGAIYSAERKYSSPAIDLRFSWTLLEIRCS